MTLKRNLESKIETAFLQTLAVNTDFGSVPIRAWMDGANGKVYPIVLVNVEPCINESYDATRQGDIYRTSVDIAAMTYNVDDRSKSALYNLVGNIRDSLNSSSLLSTLASKTSSITFLGAIVTNTQAQYDSNNTNIIMLTIDLRIKYT
jgi:hypothetical protein